MHMQQVGSNIHAAKRFLRLIAPLFLAFFILGSFTWLIPGQTSLANNQSGDCSIIYAAAPDWQIETCPTDPNIVTPMNIYLNGQLQGQAAFIRIYHQAQNSTDMPQVAVIYASGFIRLKQNADTTPPIPFGSSFVLGPAYWPNATTYYHNPQLTQLAIDTNWLSGNGPLRLAAQGSNEAFSVAYALTLPPPQDHLTRLHVTQQYTATTNVTIDATRSTERQGFKLVQVSSMFINESGSCDQGHQDCHDSNAVRFIGGDMERNEVALAGLSPSSFVFIATTPLGSTWLDALHTDDQSWQGNTPNIRVSLDALPTDGTITAQGWISATTNPDEDNVGLWLHDDSSAAQSWTPGEADRVSYWLLAEDNPPEPWEQLNLRSGWTFADFEGSYDCRFVHDLAQSTSGSVQPINGYTDTAVQLAYDLGSSDGNWAQLRCDFDPPLDLSGYDHLRFDWVGNPGAANSFEVGLINPDNGDDHIFARGYHHPSHRGWWGQLVIPFRFLYPWTDGTNFDPAQVSAFFISVVKDPVDDVGGAGSLAIDNLNAFNAAARPVPTTYESVESNAMAASTAVSWLATQQQITGLLKSWEEESTCVAHTYDQALALLVFSHAGLWQEADALVDALWVTQNVDGSWYKSRNCLTLDPVHTQKWEGDIAWAVYALNRYLASGGTHAEAQTTRDRAADWLVTRIDPADGCLLIDHTEGTIDAWWAMKTSGWPYRSEAVGLEQCLLTYYWDDAMGRFKGGKDWWQPYLDNQTWGAAFLQAIGEEEKAFQALSYAEAVLMLPAQGGQLVGFDGQGGPWSIWNEGMGQVAAFGGPQSADMLAELLTQQRADGAMPGSPDAFEGAGVWTTRWHGVAVTAWLYFALHHEPFHVQNELFLPGFWKGS